MSDGSVVEIVLYCIKRYYSRRKSHKYKAARAIPPSHLKKLNWGDIVFMAEHERKRLDGDKSVGVARIFGYFHANKLKAFCDPDIERRALSKLRVVERCRHGTVRGCGAYVVVGGFEVDNTLREVVEAYEAAAKELGKTVKFLLDGDANGFYNDVIIEGVKFARGLQWIPVLLEELRQPGVEPHEILEKAAETGEIVFVRDHELNAYIWKDARNCRTRAVFCNVESEAERR
ncbi:MAG: hypothetical protein ACXQTZ_00440 [Candidatus Alkanophagales archaeon]